ncbi:MAG: L,D-transpeptidase family protein [Vicinamibacterales bacterium]
MARRLAILLVACAAAALPGSAQPPSLSQAVERAAASQPDTLAIYRVIGFAPLWVTAGGRATPAAADALSILSSAEDDGLEPREYAAASLRERSERLTTATSAEAAAFDVSLSAALLHYLQDVHVGRIDPRSIGFTLNVPRDGHDFAAVVRNSALSGTVRDTVEEWRPRGPQYPALAAALRRYRVLAREDQSLSLGLAKAVKPGETCDVLPALRARLILLGDAPASLPLDGNRYGGPIVDAVKHFQRRHAVDADGVLGRQTVQHLETPLATRVRQLELAMERMRWLPHESDARLILVNIPMFRLLAWDSVPPSGPPTFTTATVVGRAIATQTPVFAATLTEIIFRPYWNVPTSIVRKEILPRLPRDPGYLVREQMELVAGQGDRSPVVPTTPENLAKLRTGAVRLRQRPGPKNSLGLIKFSFPNEHDVYMHATPAQALFARGRRDFSHGCVRLQDPVGLAEWVLRPQEHWSREEIEERMRAPESSRLPVRPAINVVLYYATAAVVESGDVAFADDIYRHDARLEQALDERALAGQGGEER